MSLIIQAERWCDSVVARALTSQRPVKCSAPAISVCIGCGRAVCDEHECDCRSCGKTFCPRCDHVCGANDKLAA